jgi:iron(III) transport system permease protein
MRNAICLNSEYVCQRSRFPVWQKFVGYFDTWRFITWGLALTVALPLSVILWSFNYPTREIWQHLSRYLLADLLLNTALLAGGVLGGTFILGVSLAWLTGACEFPGRKIFTWTLLLPIAMPTYVLAFVALGLMDFSGPVQTFFRAWLPSSKGWFPNVRSASGIIIVMSLALYPYVYLLARGAFRTQGKRAMEAAQSLGWSRTSSFFKVALPMARPWIAGGLLLVLMETLADFGAVSIFNFDTFTTAIYKAWFGFFSLPAAAQLSSIVVIIIFVVIAVEQKARKKMQFAPSGRSSGEFDRIELCGWKKWAATFFASGVLLIAFVIPFLQLLIWSAEIFSEEFNFRYLGFLGRSLFFALLASASVLFCSILLAYANRQHKDKFTQFCLRISTLGYALPGTVLAVGIVIAITSMDKQLVNILKTFFGIQSGSLIQGTIITVVAAYLVRFMAAGYNSINSAMHRITGSLDEASISLGIKGVSLLLKVHIPILKTGILTAAMLVFVDVMKEMPITLMTRPFGWDTLAVKIFELTSEGEWERAALPAVALVLGGLIPVIILTKQTEK